MEGYPPVPNGYVRAGSHSATETNYPFCLNQKSKIQYMKFAIQNSPTPQFAII